MYSIIITYIWTEFRVRAVLVVLRLSHLSLACDRVNALVPRASPLVV